MLVGIGIRLRMQEGTVLDWQSGRSRFFSRSVTSLPLGSWQKDPKSQSRRKFPVKQSLLEIAA